MASRGGTIGNRRVADRVCWADLVDSSQDCSRDVPAAPIVDDSYDTPSTAVEAKDGINSRFQSVLKQGPLDFTFLLNKEGVNNTSCPDTIEEDMMEDVGASSSTAPPPSLPLNASATAFVPMSSQNRLSPQPSSPEMPPPSALPASTGQKTRRIRGKRPAPGAVQPVQAPAKKQKAKDKEVQPLERDSGLHQPSRFRSERCLAVPPTDTVPPATEEEWQHRINKRQKVVRDIKNSKEYNIYIERKPEGEESIDEPIAEDRSLSKRRWEYLIQQWRSSIKSWVNEHAHDALQSAPDPTANSWSLLVGIDEASRGDA